MTVKPKLSVVTLGVQDLARSQAFYEALGWRCEPSAPDANIRFFALDGVVLALYGWDELAEDAALPSAPQQPGYRGMTLAHNEPSAAEVDVAYERFRAAGATVVKRPEAAAWGGYSGYVADPDGHLWELAHNPFDDWA